MNRLGIATVWGLTYLEIFVESEFHLQKKQIVDEFDFEKENYS